MAWLGVDVGGVVLISVFFFNRTIELLVVFMGALSLALLL